VHAAAVDPRLVEPEEAGAVFVDARRDSSAVARVDSSGVIFRVDTLASGLEVPWGLARLSDGRVLVTERTGRIRMVGPDGLQATPWATVDVYAEDPGIGPETGLMGITLAPDFATSGHVFVVATVWRSDGDRARRITTRVWRRVLGALNARGALRHKNQVIRFTEREGRGVDPTVIVDDLAAAYYHAGGGIAFGPDGMLYVSMGDAMLPNEASRPSSHLGRILRFTPTGAIPPDNPVAGAPGWAWGLRNTQAFVWLSNGLFVGVEHGPSGMEQEGGRVGHDELNVLTSGGDYGWPRAVGWSQVEDSARPLWVWRNPIAPAGLAEYRGPIEAWRGSVLVAGLRGDLERLTLRSESGVPRVVARQRLIHESLGRLRTIQVDEAGRIYLTTSNRDARGHAKAGDDVLLRLEPMMSEKTP